MGELAWPFPCRLLNVCCEYNYGDQGCVEIMAGCLADGPCRFSGLLAVPPLGKERMVKEVGAVLPSASCRCLQSATVLMS